MTVTIYVAEFKYGKARMSRIEAEEKEETFVVDKQSEKRLFGGLLYFPYRLHKEAIDKEVEGQFASMSSLACLCWLRDKLDEELEAKLVQIAGLNEVSKSIAALIAIAEMCEGEADG